MSTHRIESIAPEGHFGTYTPEMIERGIARGRQLQAEAMRNAFKRLFGMAEDKRPAAGEEVSHGGLARACAKVIP